MSPTACWIWRLILRKRRLMRLMRIPTRGPTTRKITDSCQECQNIRPSRPMTVAPSRTRETRVELAADDT